MVQKSAKRSSWEMPRISNCPKLPGIIFIYVKFFINIFSLNCFYEAKNISSLFISRKLISSLKKLNSNKFEFDSWFYRVSPIGANTLGRKRWYFHTYMHNSIILNQLQFWHLIGNIFSLSQHEVWTWCSFWRILTSSLLRTEKSFPSVWSERSQICTLPCVPHCPAIDSSRSG